MVDIRKYIFNICKKSIFSKNTHMCVCVCVCVYVCVCVCVCYVDLPIMITTII